MSRQRMFGKAAACTLSVCVLAGFIAATAGAAELSFPFTAQVPADGLAGSGAGHMNQPNGIAADPVSHRVYVADTENRRVDVFTPWGEFVRAFGWGVKSGAAELQTCTTETTCQVGLTGSGPGEFGEVVGTSQYVGPTGIAVDSSGDVYVMDLGNFRVQKFDSEGHFLLMLGGKVNITTNGNVCTKASGDTCGAGEVGAGPGEFSIENVLTVTGNYIAIGPSDTIYVGDKNRIQAFEPNGSFKSSFALPDPGNPGALAVDPKTGNLYFAYNQNLGGAPALQPNVYRLSPSGAQVGTTLPVERPFGLATDSSGNVYVDSHPKGDLFRVVKFNPSGTELGEFGMLPFENVMTALATNTVGNSAGDVDVYAGEKTFSSVAVEAVGAIKFYGAVPDPAVVGAPPSVAPEVNEQFAVSVNSDGAIVRAKINPQFWNDTTYQVEYGTVACEAGPCASTPGPPGAKLTSEVTNTPRLSGGVFLSGLAPATTYHYRFVSKSGGGGPVFGPDRTFTTRPAPVGPRLCPENQTFRTGPGAFLPDCRAYEMVSPVDKNNSDITTLVNSLEAHSARNQSAADGQKLTYSAARAFGDVQSSPFTSQYMTERDPAKGWLGKSISPPRRGPALTPTLGLDAQFKTFSPDLCSGWLLQDTALALAPGAVSGYVNLYRADLCGGAGYEPITQVPPQAQAPSSYNVELQGHSADGVHAVFRANDKLTEDAPSGEAPKVYDYSGGELRFVCVLPNGTPATACSAGTAGEFIPSEGRGSVSHAVSDDGSRIFWSASGVGPAKLYLRIDAAETIAVSKGSAQFWGASPDGSRAIFSEAGRLYEFEVEEDAPEAGSLIAEGLTGVVGKSDGVVGMSEDASQIYLVSTKALDGGAVAGKQNLYLHDEGGFTFIATLSAKDVEAPLRSVSPTPFRHAARTTADGGSLAFISSAGLTGQESVDVNSGEPDTQVYLYDAGAEVLRCVSCNRTGARPAGSDVGDLLELKGHFWAAGLLPASESQLYFSRALSEDGKRLFFNSFDALVSRDTNGAEDVYEWEAQGKGDCEEPSGCVSLISSGESPQNSEFVDADTDGQNAFFSTGASLVAQDPGLIDIYDARIGGGFPPPPPLPAGCEGESCQSPASISNEQTPASAAFRGAGNPAPRPRARRCPQGQRVVRRKDKAHCAKQGARHHKKNQSKNQRKGGRR